jgi:hypothetical protein
VVGALLTPAQQASFDRAKHAEDRCCASPMGHARQVTEWRRTGSRSPGTRTPATSRYCQCLVSSMKRGGSPAVSLRRCRLAGTLHGAVRVGAGDGGQFGQFGAGVLPPCQSSTRWAPWAGLSLGCSHCGRPNPEGLA